MNDFFGAGGSASSSSQQQGTQSPVNTPDNLRSNDRLEVMLALGHGPIKGLVNGLKSFKANDTALQNQDGSLNFLGATLKVYRGTTPGNTIRPFLGGYEDFRGVWDQITQTQGTGAPNLMSAALPTFGDLTPFPDPRTADQVVVNAALAVTTPEPYGVTFTTQSITIDALVLRLRTEALWRRSVSMVNGAYPSDGLVPNQVRFNILYRSLADGIWLDPFGSPGYEINGKALEPEIHEIRFPIDAALGGPYEVHISQITPHVVDSAEAMFFLEGYYEVVQGQYGLTKAQNVGVTLSPTVPVTRTTDAPPLRKDGTAGIDMIDIRIVVNNLVENRQPVGSDPGGTFDDELDVLIEVKKTALVTWTNPFGQAVKIKGKITGSPTVFEYRIPLVAYDGTWDVRVTRVSGDLPNFQRDIAWESLQEIVGGPARFDGIAIAHLFARASNQFNSLPNFTGEYFCKEIKVPTNYDPDTRTYTGTWNGLFKVAYTNNPAWVLYDLAMDDVYGARRFWPELNLDRYSVYEAGQWCDEMVPDGKGGSQPRYTMNIEIKEARGIREQLRYLAGAFNAVLVDELNGNLRLAVDKVTAPVAVFTPENIAGEFEYSYTDIETRYNEITVRYLNEALDYDRDARTIRDPEHQARYGVKPFDFIAVGCTNTHEAIRRAAYRMITSTTEVETVSFRTNRRGLMVRPYDTILISDPDMGRALSGRIGRIEETQRTIVYFRDPLPIEQDVLYEFNIDLPDDTAPGGISTFSYPFVGALSGPTYSIELADPLPLNVPALAPFTISAAGAASGVPKPYKLLRIETPEDDPDNVLLEAVEINRNKQAYADNATLRAGTIYVKLPGTPPAPSDVSISTLTRLVGAEPKAVVAITWRAPGDPRINSYRVQWRRTGDETWVDAAWTRGTRVEIYDVANGFYDFRVGSVFGSNTAWAEVRRRRAGLVAPPSDVALLNVTFLDNSLRLDWTPVQDRDLSHYVVRYSPVTGPTARWATAQVVVSRAVSNFVLLPVMQGTFFVKAVDTSGVYSLNAAMNENNIGPEGLNFIAEFPQDPAWAGTKTNTVVNSGLLKRVAGSANSFYFFQTSNFGMIYRCRVTLALEGDAEMVDENIADWTNLRDVHAMSAVDPSLYDFQVDIATYNGSLWSPYQTFSPGDWVGQAFRFRIKFLYYNPQVIPVLQSLKAIVDMPDRTERGRNIAVPSTGLDITYNRGFNVLPTLAVTGKNLQTGDYLEITSETVSGFRVVARNAAGAGVTRTIDWIANGYGTRFTTMPVNSNWTLGS
jgi:predicted phage tail protein